MFLSLDRFDGNYAIFEDDNQKLYEIHKSNVPCSAKPGDVLRVSSVGKLSIDVDETTRRKEKIKKLQIRLEHVHIKE